MATTRRSLLLILGSIVALVLIVILVLPLFINADSFRTRIESSLTTSLGRKVTIGKLDLSIWSGGLLAHNATVADDPAFSNQPFLQADLLKIKLELIPLLLSKEVHITGFELDSPHVTLLRAASGTWNYSSIGASSTAAPKAKTSSSSDTLTNLTVAHVDVTNGQATVGTVDAPGAPATPRRTYDQLNLSATDFSFERSFPFKLSAHLPGDGTVSLTGSAGPINQHDASLTPFTGHLVINHLDPLAAGFVDTTAGISGLVNSIDVQATWNGQQLHVANLLIDTPRLTLVDSGKPKAAPKPNQPTSSNMFSTLSADHLQITHGEITLTTPGQSRPAVYEQLNAEISGFGPHNSSPVKISAQIPGGGSLNASGMAGPLNQESPAASPFNLHANLNHLDLASSGIIAPDAGIAGLASIDAKGISDGQNLNANVAAHIDGLRVAKNGIPSTKPVDLAMAIHENMQSLAGDIANATLTIGRVPISLSGTFQTSGPTTAINLRVAAQSASIDELEAFLPAVGVHLPTGSRLQGGTLTTSLNVTGSTANPIISGPLNLDNTNLAGFDLGAKLAPITALTGGHMATGNGTPIRSLSTNLRVANGDVRTDNLAILVPSVGSATGSGSVAASGALSYQMILKITGLLGGNSGSGNTASAGPSSSSGAAGLAGSLLGMIPGGGGATGGTLGKLGAAGGFAGAALKNGIPVAIGGTTSNPTFAPNMNGLIRSGATNALQNLATPTNKQSNPASNPLGNALGGLFGKHN